MIKYYNLFIVDYISKFTGDVTSQVEDFTGFVYAIAREVEPDRFCVLDSRQNPDVDPEVLEWLKDDPVDLDEVVRALQRAGYDCYKGWV